MHGPIEYLTEHEEEVRAALARADLRPELVEGSSEKLPFQDATVHLVVTSPPYPLVEMWDAAFEATTGVRPADPRFFEACHGVLDRVWSECARVLVPGGILAVNVGDATRKAPGGDFRLYANGARVTAAAERLGLQPLVPILWKKPTNKPNAFLGSGFLPPNGYVTLDCEHVLLFRKGGPRSLPPKDPLRYASAMSKSERDVWFSQIWDVRGARQDDGLAAFPEEVPERLVRMFSALGEAVLDPFAGSGTTLRVAARLGRKPMGAEANPVLWRALRRLASIPPPSPDDIVRGIRERYSTSPGHSGSARR